jgi:uroporphyrinogen decarboxylase
VHDALRQDPALRAQNIRVALQGNLDPAVLGTTPATVRHEALDLLESMRDRHGHIFNLGHGIRPDAKPECVAALVNTVREWKN